MKICTFKKCTKFVTEDSNEATFFYIEIYEYRYPNRAKSHMDTHFTMFLLFFVLYHKESVITSHVIKHQFPLTELV